MLLGDDIAALCFHNNKEYLDQHMRNEDHVITDATGNPVDLPACYLCI